MTAADIDAGMEKWACGHGPGRKCLHCAELGEALFYSERFKSESSEWALIINTIPSEERDLAILMALKWAVGIGIEIGKGETE